MSTTHKFEGTTATTVGSDYNNACGYKLPCGLCRLLMSQCPIDTSYPNIQWTCGNIDLASAGRTNPDGRLG